MSIDFKRSLLSACEKGDLNKVDHCLKKVHVDVADEQNQTALHYAAANGHEIIVRHLVKKGAALECKNYAEWTPLMFASYYGHLSIVALLVHNKAEFNVSNQRLATPLTCAARCGHTKVIEFLLENGADCNLHEDKDVKPSVTPLMAAAQHGHLSIVSLLIMQHGINVDYQNPDTGYTALMLAAMNGHFQIVELLVKNGGANVALTNRRNQTAYQLSVIKQRKDVQEYLRDKTKKSVRISPSSTASQLSLIDATKGNKYDDVYHLIQRPGIDVNVVDDNGATPLIYASLLGQIDIVELLLKKGANTDIQDKLHGWTALMQATLKKNVEIVKMLLHYNADISIRNHKGWTVFELATIVGEPQITRMLCPRGNGIQDLSLNMESDNQGGMKTWITKVGGKMGIKQKNTQTLSRVPIQSSDIVNGSSIGDDQIDTMEESDGLRKTSSLLTVLDANKSTSGTAKAKITLVSPLLQLPDDVVAPVLPPYSKFPSFDLPKMPIKGSTLSNSHGSNWEVSPYNSSNDSTSLQQLTEVNRTTNISRPRQNTTTGFKVHHEPDSPQSSMTSSGLTSISQFHGKPVMPDPLFRSPQPMRQFNKASMAAWPTTPQQRGFPNNKSPQPMINFDSANITGGLSENPKVKLSSLSDFGGKDLSALSINSRTLDLDREATPLERVHSQKQEDIATFLQMLNIEKYQKAFDDEEVDMELLKEMNDNDLKSLPIDQTLDRQLILNALRGGLETPSVKDKSRSQQDLSIMNPYGLSRRAKGSSSKRSSIASTTESLKLLQQNSRAHSAQSLVSR